MRGVRSAVLGGVAAVLLLTASAHVAVAAPSPSPSPSASQASQSSGPSLPGLQLPSLDPQKVIYQAIAGILFAFDQTLIAEMEKVWNPMVAGSDDLSGKQNFGPGLVVDNTKLRQMWTVSFGIASGSLLVLLFALSALLWLLGQAVGSRHDIWRNLVYFLFTVILMGFSFFLVQQLLLVDNALVGAVNGQVTIELRTLLAFQNIGLKDPTAIQDVHDLLKAITTLLVIVFVAMELVVLFIVYFVRLILLWVLVVVAPFAFAFSIIPAGRGLIIYWARLLFATVAVKFINVLVFTTFVFMGATSDVALLNVILVATMLLFMIMVPATLMRALGEPGGAIMAVQQTWRATTHHQPLRQATTGLMRRFRRG
ncbi:MAG TPA: hypothetical protein VGO86_10925 [Candidatus Dormibacteraeota bacterium]